MAAKGGEDISMSDTTHGWLYRTLICADSRTVISCVCLYEICAIVKIRGTNGRCWIWTRGRLTLDLLCLSLYTWIRKYIKQVLPTYSSRRHVSTKKTSQRIWAESHLKFIKYLPTIIYNLYDSKNCEERTNVLMSSSLPYRCPSSTWCMRNDCF